MRAAAARYGPQIPPEVAERLDFELRVISEMGFSAYFLVVWDIIRYRARGGDSRRSGSWLSGGMLRRLLPAHRRSPTPSDPATTCSSSAS